MLNFDFLEKSLRLVSPSHLAYNFSIKIFLMFFINWPNFIVWLPLPIIKCVLQSFVSQFVIKSILKFTLPFVASHFPASPKKSEQKRGFSYFYWSQHSALPALMSTYFCFRLAKNFMLLIHSMHNTHIDKLFSGRLIFSSKMAWVSMVFFTNFHPMLVDSEIFLCVCILGSIATISYNNLARRQSLSLLMMLLLISFPHFDLEKTRRNWNLHKISLAIIGWAAVKKAWFTRLITNMNCYIYSRQQYNGRCEKFCA